MERTPVESSQIRSIGYDAEKLTLEIEFKGSSTLYRYFDVPPEKFKELLDTQLQSIGKYFGQHIRGKFKFEKHEPEAAEGASA